MVSKITFECLRFDGTNYAIQKIQMEGYLKYCGYDVETAYETTYTPSTNGLSTNDEIKAHKANKKVKLIVKNSLSHSKLIKV